MRLWPERRISDEMLYSMDFKRALLSENIRRGRLFAWVYVVLGSLLLALTWLLLLLGVHKPDNYSLFIIFSFVIIANAVFLFVMRPKSEVDALSDKQVKALDIYLLFHVTFMMAWGNTTCLFDQILYGQLTMFIVVTLACSAVFLISKKRLIPFAVATPILLVGLPFFQSNHEVLIGHYINAVFFTVVAFVVSAIMFARYCDDYSARKLLEESKLELEKQIEENRIINMKLSNANMMLEEMSLIDDLTGIPNRRSFRNFIDRAWRARDGGGVTLAIIMTDVDHFKDYNDSFGHVAGDEVLKQVAAQISREVKDQFSCAARWGGDEFIYASFTQREEEIKETAENIKNAVLELNIPRTGEIDRVSISMGVCFAEFTDKSSISKTIERADKALYRAKLGGRNCINYCWEDEEK